MEAWYEIAGIRMRWRAPFAWKHTKAFAPFMQKAAAMKADVDICFRALGKDSSCAPGSTAATGTVLPGERYVPVAGNGKMYLGYRIYGEECFAWMEDEGGQITCWYQEAARNRLLVDRQLFYLICPEQLLNRRHGFVLHSAFVRWKGKGILFSAPSGTGKSTQARLWEVQEGAEILNGDRTAVRKEGEQWKAFGFPFAGSSDIYRNDAAPVTAVVILRQAQDNRLIRLHQAEAFRRIYSETTVHPWDTEFLDRLIDDLQDFLEKVPVYMLECRPDREAVRIVKEQLEDMENGR